MSLASGAMAILVDAPRWPRHGTTFAHLVSDASSAELHAFAERVGTGLGRPLRFHHDHYDVPAAAWDMVVSAGARVVTTHEIVRALRAAGLRATAARPLRTRQCR